MRLTIEFTLDEDVTPDFFAQRVAEACGKYYAMRPGESLQAVDGELRYTIGPDDAETPAWPFGDAR